MANDKTRRVSQSFAPDEVQFLHDLFSRLLSAQDVKQIMRSDVASRVMRKVSVMRATIQRVEREHRMFKRCSNCGRTFSATAWAALPCIGTQSDGEIMLELRNCPCGSTIAVDVERLATQKTAEPAP